MSSENTDTRARILQAALDLLVAQSGQGVRMSDIAKRAGLSRQAIYLHFANRADLLVAATHHLDRLKESDARLEPSRAAPTGIARLEAFVAAWGGYIPEIYGVAKALLALRDGDAEAAAAWDQRMRDMREGCRAAIAALARDGDLAPGWDLEEAADLLWTLLSVRNWEHLTLDCGWSQARYIAAMQATARRLFVAEDQV